MEIDNFYYSVLIETENKVEKNKGNKIITVVNKNKEEIIKEILLPYLSNAFFYFNGYKLKNDKIIRIKIIKATKTIEELVEYKYDTMPTGIIIPISNVDIFDSNELITDITNSILNEVRLLLDENKYLNKEISNKTIFSNTKVFIVHGHDNEAKLEVARFIDQIGLKAVILSEQPNEGMTIIEKFEKYSDVGYGIVLYTECDKGCDKNLLNNIKDLNNRARQNVIFEHGYLIAKLGRNRVCALVKGDIEKPNDISGIVYVHFDAHGGWKNQLINEMKNVGYTIDKNKI